MHVKISILAPLHPTDPPQWSSRMTAKAYPAARGVPTPHGASKLAWTPVHAADLTHATNNVIKN